MAANKALWRRSVEAADRIAAPVLQGVINNDGFGVTVGLLQQARRVVNRHSERFSRQVLHRLNLPTASDVNRLLTQIAAVENRVRLLDEHSSERSRQQGHDGPRPASRTKAPPR